MSDVVVSAMPGPASAQEGRVSIWSGLTLRDLGGWRQTADVYAPPGMAPRPVVVCFHGGGWRAGSPAGYRGLGIRLARDFDVVVVSASYRLIDRALFPAQIRDAANAVRWVRQHAADWSIDPRRLAVCGDSAGGYLSAMVALTHADPILAGGDPVHAQPADVQALVVRWGPLDFIARWYGNGGRPGAEAGMLGTDYLGDPTLYHHASALAHVGPHAPPALFVQGRQDRVVHQQQAELAHAAWTRHGVSSTLALFDSIGHGGTSAEEDARATDAVVDFLARALALRPAAG